MFLRYVHFALVKAKVVTTVSLKNLFPKGLFKNVMEYALPEATIGVKWECVWNGFRVNI